MNLDRSPVQIAIVEDDPSQSAAIQRALAGNFTLRLYKNGDELFQHEAPQIFICDLHLDEAGQQGLALLKKAAELWPTTARLMTSGFLSEEDLISAINNELAHRVLKKPWTPADLKTAVTEAEGIHRLLMDRKYWQELSLTDPLTHLWNRRGLLQQILREASRSRRQLKPFSLLMIDLDDFKIVNDGKGHLSGDEVLRQTARAFTESTRAMDWICRYGGDEFAILLSETSMTAAFEVAERLRTKVKKDLDISLSIGLASFPDHGEDPGTLIEAADRALYTAKSRGRFQTAIAETPASP